ncbi:SusC/RagA family TonB-linked outer membrane protein [Changchengzhania lutea]|uniref:SusC/RagA family TonB-linked outer membrane protein n=1 Tax=Changchengzhania lutea TaxID=2049305 RepID=UPI00115EE2F8|nr:TonB-dependent receptor [Changchengzhania lutea]
MNKINNINSVFKKKRNLRDYILITFLVLININFSPVYANSIYTDNIINLQEKTITGTVTDNSGIPLPGVNIIVKGTTKGAQSDFDGNYTIGISEGEVLIFSYVGFKSLEFTVGESNIINVTMEVDNQLDEVVITAYGTSKKSSFTGSAQTVKTEAIVREATSSFEEGLQGNVAGVQIATTGQPGGPSNIRIRGVGSVNGSSQPLYVVDGVVINSDATLRAWGGASNGSIQAENPLTSINPNDIATLTVLKDAAAASLYGSRAANGVIIITTKRGQSGKTKFSFTSQLGFANNLGMENLVNGEQYKELWLEGDVNRLIVNNDNSDFKGVYANSSLYNSYVAIATTNYEQLYGTTAYNSDWIGDISRNGVTQKYNLTASGGSDTFKFFVSGEYLDQEGTFVGSDLKRYSGRINLENKANDYVSFGANLSMALRKRGATYERAFSLNPYYMARMIPAVARIRNDDGSYADLPNQLDANSNPSALLALGVFTNDEFRTRGTFWGKLDFNENLSFKSTFGIEHYSTDEVSYDNSQFGSGAGQWNGATGQYKQEGFKITSSNIVNYNKVFNEKHTVSALAGFEIEDTKAKWIGIDGYDVLDDDLLAPNGVNGNWGFSGNETGYGLVSFLSQVNYDFDKKYYLSGSFRRDGSSRFGINSRWGNFWAISGAWRISQENFMEGKDGVFQDMKLRASYGTNGNLPSQLYAHLPFFSGGNGYGDDAGVQLSQVANENLSWETSENFNIGFDFQLFDKYAITLEYFNKKTDNILLDVPISSTSGFNTALRNYGSMENSGLEFSLGASIIEQEDFTWNTTINTSTLKNKITQLPSDIIITSRNYDEYPIIRREGENFYSFYLRDYKGVNPETGSAQWYVLDNNGNRTGSITEDYQEAGYGIFGQATQDVQGGFSNEITYKNWSFNFLFTYGIGGSVYDLTSYKRDDDGARPQYTVTTNQLNRWTPTNTNTNVPVRINGATNGSNAISTRYLYSADYLKLKNIRLGYNVPIKNKYIQSVNLYALINNVFLSTELDGYDPESSINGVNFYQIPTARSFTLGLKLDF